MYFFTFCAFKIDQWANITPLYSCKKWQVSKSKFFIYSGNALSSQASSQALHFFKLTYNRLRIPTGRTQTSWLCTSAAEELSQGLPGTNPASGQSGTWNREIPRPRCLPLMFDTPEFPFQYSVSRSPLQQISCIPIFLLIWIFCFQITPNRASRPLILMTTA